jgi:hypothetical protein
MKMHGDTAYSLHRVGMDRNASGNRETCEQLHGLKCTNLVVCEHQGSQSCPIAEFSCHPVSICEPVGIDVRAIDDKSFGFESCYWLGYSRVLDGAGYKMARTSLDSSQPKDG